MTEPEPLSAEERLRDAISGERGEWHRVDVDPRDIAALLAARVAAPSDGLRAAFEAGRATQHEGHSLGINDRLKGLKR